MPEIIVPPVSTGSFSECEEPLPRHADSPLWEACTNCSVLATQPVM